jgi:hypothetical protein
MVASDLEECRRHASARSQPDPPASRKRAQEEKGKTPMKDDAVIAHQARKIAELEIKAARALEGEQQLLAILRRAGVEVTEVELSRDEAEFLKLYRDATPEGKAGIQAMAEEMAGNSGMNSCKGEDLSSVGPGRDDGGKEEKKSNTSKGGLANELEGLPRDFFKRNGN